MALDASLANGLRPAIKGIGIGTNRAEHVAGLGTAWTMGGAITALMTQEDIGVSDQFVSHSPLRPNHFLAGKRLTILAQGADDGTGRTLIALLQCIARRPPSAIV